MKIKILLFLAATALLTNCKPEIDAYTPSAGQADFSKYLAIGNSLTAGFADNELYKSGQQYSFPNILAEQMKLVGGGAFNVPYMFDEEGFGNKLMLGFSTDCLGVTSLSPVPVGPGPNIAQNMQSIGAQGPFNNMGVPGVKSFHLAYPGYGTKNPYFGRFAKNLATSSILSDAALVGHTFFTFFVGNMDVLAYAVAGGNEGIDSITKMPVFTASILNAMNKLLIGGAKGAIANIPDISDVPYFTTVPAMGLVLTDAQASQLNAGYTAYNAGAQQVGVPQIVFHAGANAFVIQDTHYPYNVIGGLRQIKSNEFICLKVPQDSLKCKHWGSQKPIPAYYILDELEIAAVKAATTDFNGYLKSVAEENGLAFVDFNTYFKSFVSGMVFDGVKLSSTFVTGGLFSVDGVHPNPRGQAVLANYFIDAINAKYSAKIPKVNISDYPGVTFP